MFSALIGILYEQTLPGVLAIPHKITMNQDIKMENLERQEEKDK